MKTWADFHPRVMPYVLGCPVPVVDADLIDAAREFCEKTSCWKFVSTANVFPYDSRAEFDPDLETEVIRVDSLTINGEPYDIKSTHSLPADWRANPPDDKTLYHDNLREFLIFPTPAATDSVEMTMVLKPTSSATGVSDDVFAMHAEAISYGARARLQRMPRQPWSDMAQAQLDGLLFSSFINRAANVDFIRAKHHRVTKQEI